MSREKIYNKDNLPQPNIDKKGNAFKDLSNKKFGKLTALYPVNKTKDNKWQWLCRCECGKYTLVRGNYLSCGHTTSCGCYNTYRKIETNLEDISGQTFNQIYVIKYYGSKKEHAQFLAKCLLCGKEFVVSKEALRNGQYSCGCAKQSKYERAIEKILIENHIIYKKEYTFKDLVGKNNNKLRFDFAIMNSNNKLIGLIEMQGQQHYTNSFGISDEEFQYSLERDKIKKQYCLEHNIPLNCIKYNEKITKERVLNEFRLEENE